MTDADEEAREYLQTRLEMVFKLMFWSLVGLMAFIAALYAISAIADHVKHRGEVIVASAVGLAIMAAIWRGLLARRKLSMAALHRIDLLYVVGIGTAFAISAVVQAELRPAGYMSLVWATFTVFSRALVVPSSARRTAILSALAFVPMSIAALYLARTAYLVQVHTDDLPGLAFFFGFVLLSTVPIVLATTGSYIIYDLNRQVSAAQQLGQYRLDRKIGEGGMGSVYVARHMLLRRPTAVKILPPDRNRADELERFEREVRSMSKLSHPNTVAVFDYGHSADGGLYYAMEYLAPGIDLQRLVMRDGPMPAGRVAALLAQVCGALGEAHELGIVHRDVKPGNIIVCERGGMPDIAKVVDFGIAKQLGDDAHATFGTPGYLAPEVLTGTSVTAAADLYALGAVGYFLLTGRRVFEGTPAEICAQHAGTVPAPPSQVAAIHVAPELEAIVMRCLAMRPADRYASAAELGDALRAVPATADWSEAHARDWWHTFKRAEPSEPSATSSLDTITIDLGVRIA